MRACAAAALVGEAPGTTAPTAANGLPRWTPTGSPAGRSYRVTSASSFLRTIAKSLDTRSW